MLKTLIFYKPENIDTALKLRDNYLAHDYEVVDIISEKEQDDVEFAREMQYEQAIFVEDSKTVIIHDIKTWHTDRMPVSDVFYKD